MTATLSFSFTDDKKWRIYTSLRDWILYTKLKPGQRIKERELAALFGVSRTPLREVLQLLAYQGLLVIKPRQGVFVAPIEDSLVVEVLETRMPLEIAVARLAAQRASQADVKELTAIAVKLNSAIHTGKYKKVIVLDSQFHDTLARATGNITLRQTRESLHNICLRYWFLMLDNYIPGQEEIQEHQRLALAISHHQADRAAEIQKKHILRFLKRIQPCSGEESFPCSV
ncbi:MAG: GntR family transcriptional regulator [Deltaproteobacteria bacterium]|nr:MAG: GntR family transcriptional regulator [Deltaproteobacteria bacterium]